VSLENFFHSTSQVIFASTGSKTKSQVLFFSWHIISTFIAFFYSQDSSLFRASK